MNGQRIPRTPIVVDYWNLGKVPPRCLFFLTHMHADHTSGLNASWPYPIHCTAVTGKLLVRKFKIDPKLVVELEVGESRMLHVDRCGNHVTITVTTIDANHCPGSAMFLFEGYFGRILYTGDFRFSPSMLDNPLLNGSRSVDVLYLDNTYCDPSCKFPTREEATRTLISLIKEKRDRFRTVVIGLHTLGKEELLVELATSLRQWVGVSSERMTTLKLLELPDVFTTDMRGSFFQVHPFYLVAKNRLAEMSSEDVLAVLPTCLYSGRGALPQPNGVVVVPYSDHSSFEELKCFVKAVRPRCIKPIVKSFSGDRSYISAVRGDMTVFNEYLNPSPPQEYHMPTGTEDLAKNNSQISYPSPLSGPIPTPTVRRSHSYSSGSSSSKAQLRSRSMGVRFLSPAKSKSPENLEVDNSNDQDCYQLKNLDDARQDTVWGVDNSDNSRDKVRPDAPFSEANSVQFVDLTNSAVERQSESIPSVSENPLQSSSSAILSFDLPSLARVEPASSSTLPLTQQQSGKTNDSASSSSGSMFVQTKLDAFTRPIGSTSIQNTNASATVQPRYFTEKTRSPAVSLSLEEPVTCARVVPLEALKLERNKKCNNEPRIMERGGCQKTADSEDTEGRSEITRAADLVEKPAAMIPAVSSVSYQDSVSQCHAQPHACESIEDITDESRAHYDDELETDSDVQYTDSPSTCARLMPVEFVKFKRSGQDDRVAVESDTSPSPSQLESKDTRDLNLPETNATNVKVIDLTLLVDSQSPSPKSPESNTHPSGFQGLNSGFQSPKHSIALIAAEGSSDHHYSAQGSSPNSANSANILTPLPKVGSPNVTDALYGKEPSQRSQNSRSSSGTKRKQLLPQPLTFLHDPFNTPSSSLTSISAGNKFSFGDLPQAPASKRPKLSTDNGGDETELQTTTSATAAAKSRRVLPAFLQPGSTREQEKFNNCSKSYDSHSCGGYSRGQVEAGVGVCVCGRGETQRVPMCRQCRASIIKLNRSGLFGRLSKLDLSSPEICQVIHDAVDNLLACHQKSGTTAAGQETPLLPCTCEDRKHTRCFCGLEEYVLASNDSSQTSRNDANFDNLVIEIDV